MEGKWSSITTLSMIVNIPIVCTAVIQTVLSLAILANCSSHWASTIETVTDIAHIPVLFAMRALPTLSLFACGVAGIVASRLRTSTAVTVYNTMTMHTACILLFLTWFFAYHLLNDQIPMDLHCSKRCVGLVGAAASICVVYLTYTSIVNYMYWRKHMSLPEATMHQDPNKPYSEPHSLEIKY